MRKWIAVAQAVAGLGILLVGDLPRGTEAAAYAVILTVGAALWPSSIEPEPDHEGPVGTSWPSERGFDAMLTHGHRTTVGGSDSVEVPSSTERGHAADLRRHDRGPS